MQKSASTPTIKRLPSYLHVIEAVQRAGLKYISSTSIAAELDIDPIQVRKDLAVTGIVGKPRIGFPVDKLVDAIHSFLSWNRKHHVVIIGAGNLGTAIMGHTEFRRHGMNIIAAFDSDEEKTGKLIHSIPVYAINDLFVQIREFSVEIAILTVPPDQAQDMAELLVSTGIRAIWNFTNIKLKVPSNIIVQKEDLSSGYAVLSVKFKG